MDDNEAGKASNEDSSHGVDTSNLFVPGPTAPSTPPQPTVKPVQPPTTLQLPPSSPEPPTTPQQPTIPTQPRLPPEPCSPDDDKDDSKIVDKEEASNRQKETDATTPMDIHDSKILEQKRIWTKNRGGVVNVTKDEGPSTGNEEGILDEKLRIANRGKFLEMDNNEAGKSVDEKEASNHQKENEATTTPTDIHDSEILEQKIIWASRGNLVNVTKNEGASKGKEEGILDEKVRIANRRKKNQGQTMVVGKTKTKNSKTYFEMEEELPSDEEVAVKDTNLHRGSSLDQFREKFSVRNYQVPPTTDMQEASSENEVIDNSVDEEQPPREMETSAIRTNGSMVAREQEQLPSTSSEGILVEAAIVENEGLTPEEMGQLEAQFRRQFIAEAVVAEPSPVMDDNVIGENGDKRSHREGNQRLCGYVLIGVVVVVLVVVIAVLQSNRTGEEFSNDNTIQTVFPGNVSLPSSGGQQTISSDDDASHTMGPSSYAASQFPHEDQSSLHPNSDEIEQSVVLNVTQLSGGNGSQQFDSNQSLPPSSAPLQFPGDHPTAPPNSAEMELLLVLNGSQLLAGEGSQQSSHNTSMRPSSAVSQSTSQLKNNNSSHPRLVAYVGNWQPCPTPEQVEGYTHIVIAFAVSYMWAPERNDCSQSCDIAMPPICANSPAPDLVQQWKEAGIKVLFSFGGAGMGGTWDGDVNDCWEYCFGRETHVVNQLVGIITHLEFDGVDLNYLYHYEDHQQGSTTFNKSAEAKHFMTQVTIGLRDLLPEDSIITHSAQDTDAALGSAYFDILEEVAPYLDFIMILYYNGLTSPVSDGVDGEGYGLVSALSHYTALVDEIFDGNAEKVAFGFCIAGCTRWNANGEQAAQVMVDLSRYYTCNGGASFWAANDDTNGAWSNELRSSIKHNETCTNYQGLPTSPLD